MQILDDEPPPQESHFDEVKKERLARAAAQKKKFQEDLLAKPSYVKHDHGYFLTDSVASDTCVTEEKGLAVQPHLVNELYQNHVVLNFDQIKSLEADTRTHSDSELWFNARRFRITASIMKEVCHRKGTTVMKHLFGQSFLQHKLQQQPFVTENSMKRMPSHLCMLPKKPRN